MTANPYLLPEGPVAVQFSGGRTSGYMLQHIIDAHGGTLPTDCHVLFQNTGRERPETLEFVEECSLRMGVEIVWLEYAEDDGRPSFARVGPGTNRPASTNGEPLEMVFRRRNYLPNPVTRFCTTEAKARPSAKYMRWLGYESWTSVLGIRADEQSRIVKPGCIDRATQMDLFADDDFVASSRKKKQRWTNYYPLSIAGVSRHAVTAWWSRQPFDLRLPTAGGNTPHGNCDGCFMKSERTQAALARFEPERAAWWEEMERRYGATFRSEPGRDWATMRRLAERLPDLAFDPDNDMLCDADLGGCHD